VVEIPDFFFTFFAFFCGIMGFARSRSVPFPPVQTFSTPEQVLTLFRDSPIFTSARQYD